MIGLRAVAVSMAVVISLVGCAGANVRPLVDMKNKNTSTYEQDLTECQTYATEQSGAAANGAVGAIAGAVFGALLGLVAGGNQTGIAQVGGIGAVAGAFTGLLEGNKAQEGVVKQCLRGRGYNVLN